LHLGLTVLWRYRDFKNGLHSIKELRKQDPDPQKVAEKGRHAADSLLQVLILLWSGYLRDIKLVHRYSGLLVTRHGNRYQSYSFLSCSHVISLTVLCGYTTALLQLLFLIDHLCWLGYCIFCAVQLLKPQVTPQRFWLPLLRDAVWLMALLCFHRDSILIANYNSF